VPGGHWLPGVVEVAGIKREAAAWVFRKPRSYTGDDTIELHLGSCLPILDSLQERAVAAGARLAQPGEFTRRAFLAGKLDLTEAEAVQDLSLCAHTEAARRALRQLRGGLRREVETAREAMLSGLCHLEAALDFSAEDLDGALIERAGVTEKLAAALASIDALLSRERIQLADSGAPRVCLFGPPNAGKSSLFNALVERDRVLTSPEAGTTRDAVEALLMLERGCVELVDLAGVECPESAQRASGHHEDSRPSTGNSFRSSEEPLEVAAITREAEARAHTALGGADLTAIVLDGSAPLTEAERNALATATSRRHIVILQKADLGRAWDPPPATSTTPWLRVSAHTGAGLGTLRNAIGNLLFGNAPADAGAPAPNARHAACLSRARDFLVAARDGLTEGRPPELAAIDLRAALDALEAITGLSTCTEDVLDRIFSTFCLGK
jgi:tRNA modification GTPase